MNDGLFARKLAPLAAVSVLSCGGPLDTEGFEQWTRSLSKACTVEDVLPEGPSSGGERPRPGVDLTRLAEMAPTSPRVPLSDGSVALLFPIPWSRGSTAVRRGDVEVRLSDDGECVVTERGEERYRARLADEVRLIGAFDARAVGTRAQPFRVAVREVRTTSGPALSFDPGYLVDAFTRALPAPAELTTRVGETLGLDPEGAAAVFTGPLTDGVSSLSLRDVAGYDGEPVTALWGSLKSHLTGPAEALAPLFTRVEDGDVELELLYGDPLRQTSWLTVTGIVRLSGRGLESPGIWTGRAEVIALP